MKNKLLDYHSKNNDKAPGTPSDKNKFQSRKILILSGGQLSSGSASGIALSSSDAAMVWAWFPSRLALCWLLVT